MKPKKVTKAWTCKDGTKLRICDMTDSHLLNAERMIRRNASAIHARDLSLAYGAFAVYMDSLVRRGRHWQVEPPQCRKQNPHGNLFESFMHLIANISEASFDIEMKVRTRWMHDNWQTVRAKCHL